MIYYALRSSNIYFANLESIRTSDSSHVLVSVAGGLAFLHAIGVKTDAICIFDSDPEVLEYTKLILLLIERSSSLKDFVEVITGYEFHSDQNGWRFGEPVDQGERARSLLPELPDYFYFMRTLGRVKVQPELEIGNVDDSTILFRGNDLTPMTFCWRLGEGCLADESTFSVLRDKVRDLPRILERCTLESLDWKMLPQGPVVFLASNLESPLFTRGDVILRSIFASGVSVPVRYVSWYRDFLISPVESWRDWISERLISLVRDSRVAGLSYVPAADERAAMRSFESFSSVSEIYARKVYGHPLLVIDIDNLSTGDSPGEDLVKAIAPYYGTIVFFGTGRGTDFLSRGDVAELFESYSVGLLDQLYNRFIVRFDLRGVRKV